MYLGASLPGKLFMNIQAPLSSISNILHMKNEPLVILELDRSIYVLIKHFNLDWKNKLEVNCIYVFRNLRLSLLEKGIYRPHPIFIVWANSSFIKVTENEIPTIPMQTWLEKNCIKDFVAIDYPLTKVTNKNPHDQLHHYEGTVTSVDETLKGFYILDGKIGLYVGSLTPSDIRSKLKLQTKVVIYNAHLIQGSQLSFVCCVKTNLKIESQSLEESINKEITQEGSYFDFSTYGMNMKEVDLVHTFQDKLVKLGRSRQESIISSVKIYRKYFIDVMSNQKLNLVDNFIFHEEMCPYLNFSFNRCHIPNVLDLTSLKIEPVSSLSVLCSNDHHCKRHSYQLVDSKVLIGRIQISSSGQTFFQDDTDIFPLVLLDSGTTYETKGDNISLDSYHSCSQSCLKLPKLGSKIKCPLLTSDYNGKLLSVGQFSVIYENFNSSGAPGSECGIYLAFSLCDCITLGDSSEKNSSKILPTFSSNHESDKYSMYFHVTEKHALKYSKESRGVTHFDLVGFEVSSAVFDNYDLAGEVGKPESRKNNVTDASSLNRNDLATNIKTPAATHSKCTGQDIDKCSVLFRPTDGTLNRVKPSIQTHSHGQKYSENTVHSGDDSNCQSNVVSSERLKPLLLSFSKGYYHSLMSQGQTYKLTASRNDSSNPFQTTFLNSKLQKAAENCNVRFQIVVPLDVTLTRLTHSLSAISSLIHRRPLYSVDKILSSSFSDCFVSFQAVVIHHEYCSLSLNNLNNGSCNMKLDVMGVAFIKKDEFHDGDKLSVYIDVFGLVPILGLIPGSQVLFHNLERKVSKAGRVYVRFIAVSSVQVIAFHDITGFKLRHTQQTYKFLENDSSIINMATLPKELLIDLTFLKPTGLYCIDCHICMFFKLGIKVICLECKGVVQRGKCQGTACGKSTFSVVTSAVILLDDGSSQASVKFWGPNLVRQLLTLQDNQWNDLVESVKEEGEILITKMNASKGLSRLTCFLDALINSPVVLRPCRVAVRKSKVSAEGVDVMTMEELEEKEEKIGQHMIKTLSLPILKLDGYAVQSLD